MATELHRAVYADLFGPTTGDRIRLADTDLLIEIEDDLSGGPGISGDEAVFGGGKVIRESMGQSRVTRAEGAPDTVITGAVVLDHWGVVKADIGIRDGRIAAIGKAGNPETMDGVHPELVIGPETEIIAGNGKILTAGAIDAHVHFICPQLVDEALASGITTLVGGGTGPAEGSKATTITPGRLAPGPDVRRRWTPTRSTSGCSARATRSTAASMHDQLRGRRARLQDPRGLGRDPRRDRRLPGGLRGDRCPTRPAHRHVERGGVRRATPSPPSRAAACTRTTPKARAAGTRPTSSRVVSQPNILPRSTNPTRPHTVNTVEEHLDMLMVCHHLNPAVPEDLAFAESRIRPSTIAAEDVLHDLGAISIISSDSQAMGRIGEVVLRTWQTAHVMKRRRGTLPGDGRADNHRARRYVAKYTINPAVAQGLDGLDRFGRGGQARRPGAVEPGVLRREAARWSSRAGRSRTRRWATPTPPSPPRNRCCPGRCSGPRAGRPPPTRSTSLPRRHLTTVSPTGWDSANASPPSARPAP